MKHPLFLLLAFMLFLAACSPAATPAPTVDAAAAARVISQTMAAATLTAQPSATPVPSPTQTETPAPTTTETPAVSMPPTETSAPAQEANTTQPVFQGTLAPGGASGPTGLFRIENQTSETLLVTIQGQIKKGLPYYISYYVKKVFLFNIPWGSYTYIVQVGNKKTFSGSFGIANDDKTTMIVENNKVKILGP